MEEADDGDDAEDEADLEAMRRSSAISIQPEDVASIPTPPPLLHSTLTLTLAQCELYRPQLLNQS